MLKILEYIGVTLAAIGFACLSLGYLGIGFAIGLFSCAALILYFEETKQKGLLLLQFYFAVFNLIGVYKAFF